MRGQRICHYFRIVNLPPLEYLRSGTMVLFLLFSYLISIDEFFELVVTQLRLVEIFFLKITYVVILIIFCTDNAQEDTSISSGIHRKANAKWCSVVIKTGWYSF